MKFRGFLFQCRFYLSDFHFYVYNSWLQVLHLYLLSLYCFLTFRSLKTGLAFLQNQWLKAWFSNPFPFPHSLMDYMPLRQVMTGISLSLFHSVVIRYGFCTYSMKDESYTYYYMEWKTYNWAELHLLKYPKRRKENLIRRENMCWSSSSCLGL